MKRITNNTAAMVALIGTMIFWFFLPFVGTEAMLEVSSNMLLGLAFAVAFRWSLPAYNAIRSGGNSGTNFLAIAIFGVGLFTFFHRLWVNSIRWMDRPSWALESPITAFAIWCVMISLAMIVLAPGTERGIVPRENFFWLLASVSIGSMAAGVMIGASFFGS